MSGSTAIGPRWVPNTGLLMLAVVGLLFVSPARAQDAPARDPQPASAPTASAPALPSEYWLRISRNRVNLRLRPDVSSLIAARVDSDTYLRAAGSEGDWHRIAPPRGVFSIVAAQFVEMQDANRGVVSVESGTLRVRAGSRLVQVDPMLTEVQALLERGDTLDVLGRDGEWLRITPPEGVYLYVHKDFVERVPDETAARVAPELLVRYSPDSAADPSVVVHSPTTTQPVHALGPNATWAQRLAAAQALIDAELVKPRLDRDWQPVLDALKPIAAQQVEPDAATRASAALKEVEQRLATQLAMREATQESAARAAEREAQLARDTAPVNTPQQFNARGILQGAFTIDPGEYGLRYKLVDPRTRKVNGYVEFPTALGINIRELAGKYVGVSGETYLLKQHEVYVIRASSVTVLTSGPASPVEGGRP